MCSIACSNRRLHFIWPSRSWMDECSPQIYWYSKYFAKFCTKSTREIIFEMWNEMVNMRINYEAYKLITYSVLFTRRTHTHTKSADFACKSMTSVDFGQNVGFAPRQHEVKWNIQRIYSMIISDWRRCQWEILKIHRRLCNDRMFSKTEFDKSSKMAFKVENSVSTSFKNAFSIRIAPPFCVESIFYELFFYSNSWYHRVFVGNW